MIEKVILKKFGIHKDRTFTFKKGINIIIGQNRLGKSSIFEGITFALFGKTKNSKIEKIINYGAKQAEAEIFIFPFNIHKAGEVNIDKASPVPPKKRRGRPKGGKNKTINKGD